MKKLVIILVTLLAFSACERDKYYYIPDNKVPSLKTGDIRYFVNNQDNSIIDTFVLDFERVYQDYDKTVHHERSIEITYKKADSQASMNSIIFRVYANSESVQFKNNYMFYNSSSCDIPVDTVKLNINGIKYETVFVKKTDRIFENLPITVYYSYKDGILRYDYSDTNYYEIKK